MAVLNIFRTLANDFVTSRMTDCNYRIVYCTPAIYSVGGTERVVTAKANYFAETLGYDVTIIVTEGNDDTSFFPLSDKVQVINLHLNFEELWEKPFIRKVILYIQKISKYRKLLQQELMKIRPDITISTLRREINFINDIGDGSLKVGELHLSRSNFRSFEADSFNVLKKIFHFWWKNNLVSSLKRLDKFVVLTENAKTEWPELDNLAMIPDPLTLNVGNHVSSLKSNRVIAIGRYAYEKGYDLLLQAWAIVEKQYPDWRLDLYGMGNRNPYEELLKELHVNPERCLLHGSLSDVMKAYLDSSLLVLPSRTEGFGLVLLEAMACGVPVVAFDCSSGPGSIVSDGVDGILVPSNDIESLAARMMLLMGNEILRVKLGENGCRKADDFTMDKIGRQWKDLFDELMQHEV